MGDPRSFKKKFQRPGHPWQLKRMEEERVLKSEFGLKNKRELWKAGSSLKVFANEAKRLTALRTTQAEREKKQLLDRVTRIGLLASGAVLDDVLALTTKDLLARRLQTLVHKKGLARTANQARQLIVHGHVKIADKTVTAPSMIVSVADESQLTYVANSSFSNPEHPERTIKKTAPPRAPPPRDSFRRDGQRPQRRQQRPNNSNNKPAAPAGKPEAKKEAKK